MWEIWANLLLPKTLKSCPKSNKSPNLVTLTMTVPQYLSQLGRTKTTNQVRLEFAEMVV